MLIWLKSWDHAVFNKPVVQTKQNITPSMFNRNQGSNNAYQKTGDYNYL